jgi:putative nucleotidyltransferase with HDIG domain
MNDKGVDLRAAIRNLDSLPTLPLVAQKILRLPLDTLDGEQQLLQLIERDPQISARTIGLANSPLFGSANKITSIRDAAMMLGINRIKSVSVGIAVMSTFTRQPSGHLYMQKLWLHSLGIALAMCSLARALPSRSRPLDDEVFFAGLLHDIGFMALNHIDPVRSDLLQSRLAATPDRPVNEVEAKIIEIGHAELGAELAQHWDLPDSIVAVLRYHHTQAQAKTGAGQPLIGLLNLAERLLPVFGISEHVATDVTEQDWQALDIDPRHAEELVSGVRQQAEQARIVATTL